MGKKSGKDHTRTTAITPASLASTLTSFSSSPAAAKYYAHLHRAPDAHTLRVFDVLSGKCVSRWASEEGDKVACVAWAGVPGKKAAAADEGEDASKRGKKRRKSDSAAAGDEPVVLKDAEATLVLALGMEDGSIVLWTPTGTDTAGTKLAHSTSTAPVTALSSPQTADREPAGHLWSAHADGSVLYWDLTTDSLIGKLTGHLDAKSTASWDDLAVRYVGTVGEGRKRKYAAELVLARKSIRVFALDVPTAKKDAIREAKATELAKCTGHVGETFLQWLDPAPSASAMADDDEDAPLAFVSFSPTDRFVQVWSIPSSPSATSVPGTLLSRFALDSPVQSIALASTTLAAVDSEGKASVGTVDLAPSEPKAKGVRTIKVESSIDGPVSRVAFGAEGSLRVCRAGVKPAFELVVRPFSLSAFENLGADLISAAELD